jgi:hypothetical protein
MSEDKSIQLAQEMLYTMHEHFGRLMEAVVDPTIARAILDEKRKAGKQNVSGDQDNDTHTDDTSVDGDVAQFEPREISTVLPTKIHKCFLLASLHLR